MTVEELVEEIKATWPVSRLHLHEHPARKLLVLDTLVVRPDARGHGAGTEALKAILAYADAKGLRVSLTPEPIGWGSAAAKQDSREFKARKKRLEKWYAAHGFKQHSDFSVSERLLREPQTRKNPMSSKKTGWITVKGGCDCCAPVRKNPSRKTSKARPTRGEGKYTDEAWLEDFVNDTVARFAASEEGRALSRQDGEALSRRLGAPTTLPLVRVKFTPGTSNKGGECQYKASTGECIIRLHGGVWAEFTEEERFDTVLHETAHAIEFRRYGGSDHAARWQHIAKSIGGSGTPKLPAGASAKLDNFERKKKGLPPPPTKEEMEAARELWVVGDWVSFDYRKGRGKAASVEKVEGKIVYRKQHHATVQPANDDGSLAPVRFDVPYYQLRRALPPEMRPAVKEKVPGVDKPLPGESLSAWQARTGRARNNPAPPRKPNFDQAMEHAAAFVAALESVQGAPRGKGWGKPGVGVRVYVGRDWLSVGHDGTVRGAGPRGGGTFLEGSLYPSQRRAYKQAMDAYLVQQRQRLADEWAAIEAEMEDDVRDNPTLTGFDFFDVEDDEPSPPSGKTLEGVKRGDVLQVGKSKWVVFQKGDNYTAYAFKHPSKHKKAYRIRPDNEGGADVHEIDGMSEPVALVVHGPLVRTGEKVDLA